MPLGALVQPQHLDTEECRHEKLQKHAACPTSKPGYRDFTDSQTCPAGCPENALIAMHLHWQFTWCRQAYDLQQIPSTALHLQKGNCLLHVCLQPQEHKKLKPKPTATAAHTAAKRVCSPGAYSTMTFIQGLTWLREAGSRLHCASTLQVGPGAISGSQSALFHELEGRICALQPNCVDTDRLQQVQTVAQTDGGTHLKLPWDCHG